MKVILVKTNGELPEVVETQGGFKEWQRLIGCGIIDIASHEIGGKTFDCIVDDEGLFCRLAIPTMIDQGQRPLLVGNIVICNYDPETGGEAGLTDSDIATIKKNIVRLTSTRDDFLLTWYAVMAIK